MLTLQRSTIGFTTEETDLAFEKMYAARFRSVQSPSSLNQASNEDLRLLLKAALFAATYNRFSIPALDALRDLHILKARHIAIEDDYVETYECLITARLFTQARALSSEFRSPILEKLPAFTDLTTGNSLPTIMTLSPNGARLVRSTYSLSSGRKVLIVSTPLCHFCVRAAHDVDEDPVLRKALSQNVTWLCAVTDAVSFEDVMIWNLQHHQHQMVIAYKMQEWPQIRQWSTPIFYFFRNGKLEDTVTGWPAGGNKAAVLAALKRLASNDAF